MNNSELIQILEAVGSTDYDGIYCEDVLGMNWFDARDKAIAALSAKPEPLPEVEKYAALVLPHLAMYAVSHSEPMKKITGRHFTSVAAEMAVQFAKALVTELEKKSSGESK
jgi:hypothetical protein